MSQSSIRRDLAFHAVKDILLDSFSGAFTPDTIRRIIAAVRGADAIEKAANNIEGDGARGARSQDSLTDDERRAALWAIRTAQKTRPFPRDDVRAILDMARAKIEMGGPPL